MIKKKVKNNLMNISKFFKVLNHKINKYSDLAKDNYYTNPFSVGKKITVYWVEDTNDNQFKSL